MYTGSPKCFDPDHPTSTLRIMPPIEFAFCFFRFIPPMGGRRVFTKMIQRPIESNNKPVQIFTQSDLLFLLLPLANMRFRTRPNSPQPTPPHPAPRRPAQPCPAQPCQAHPTQPSPGQPCKAHRHPRPMPPKHTLSSPAPALPSLTPTFRTTPPSPAQPNPAQPSPAQPSPTQYYPDLTRNSTVNSSDLLSLLKISISTLQI